MSSLRVSATLLIACFLVLFLGPGAQAAGAWAAPAQGGATLPYSGRLADEAGQPVADGAYDFGFALYAAADGGPALWTETQTGVPVKGGAFAVLLGAVTPVPKPVTEYTTLWLAVSVRAPGAPAFTTLTPRQRLSAAPTAGPDVPASCVHDHFSEWWVGSSAQAGLVVDNRTGDGDGIRGYASAAGSNYGGVYGVNFNTGPGVYGRGDGGGPGVAGYSSGRGVYGNGADGVVGESATDWKSGVYGVNPATNGYGVTGRGEGYFGVFAWGNDVSLYDGAGDIVLQGTRGEIFSFGDYLDLYTNNSMYIDLDNDNNTSFASFQILSGDDIALWTIQESSGDVVAAGTQASVAQTADYGGRLLYAVEGTGVWVEDVGTATLAKGVFAVAFDPVYIQTVDLSANYQVFVTPLSEQPVVLYVSDKTAAGFTVHGVTLDGRPADVAFDYRIVAQRLGDVGTRLATYTQSVPPGKEQR